ncbi:hypothetical protein [Mycolicibacterium fortuitum]|uniref:hypothetical protein n=1 Tax=Mycolicibacterium fortuitum TaxID=1766 RepID=UPI0007EB38AF|nr:hypothetical protein [Mycolicibacterium fortuitum]TPW91702.1 hypothetical protein FKW78_26490 [Mycolicibacterium fortuitum]UBV24103.1 hypothetical protein H8Z59_13835 [Mycolicibacterium fortuitum]
MTSRAEQLVAEVNATWRRDDFDIASPLADDVDSETSAVLASNVADVRQAVESINHGFNLGAGIGSKPTGQGFSAALTADFDERIRNLSELVLTRHRAIESEKLWVMDYRLSEDGLSLLPPWDKDNPLSANVIRGILATNPQVVYVLRGGFNAEALARAIWLGKIPTLCNVNVSHECDLKAQPVAYRDGRKVWGVFTTAVGEYLIFHTVCSRCFFEFWPMDSTGHSAHYRIN